MEMSAARLVETHTAVCQAANAATANAATMAMGEFISAVGRRRVGGGSSSVSAAEARPPRPRLVGRLKISGGSSTSGGGGGSGDAPSDAPSGGTSAVVVSNRDLEYITSALIPR
jgi:hypothetical protein